MQYYSTIDRNMSVDFVRMYLLSDIIRYIRTSNLKQQKFRYKQFPDEIMSYK